MLDVYRGSGSEHVGKNLGIQFVESYYDLIQAELELRLNDRRSNVGTHDPFSLDNCRTVLSMFTPDQLSPYGLIQSGGRVRVSTPSGSFEDNHSYFGSLLDPDFVADFQIGQYAERTSTVLDTWISRFPKLFYGRAFVGGRRKAAKELGIRYPEKNQYYLDYFWNGTR